MADHDKIVKHNTSDPKGPVKKNGKNPKAAAGKNLKAAAGKNLKAAAGKQPAKSLKAVMEKKPVRKIVEFYYFLNQEITVRDMLAAVGEYDPKSDIWPELNLMEVEMNFDSLIFQDAKDCFVDPEDLAWLEENHILSKYHMSYDTADIEDVKKVMKNIMTVCGGIVCSDTDDFMPMYGLDQIEMLA